LRYGVDRAPLEKSAVTATQLLDVLVDTFVLLAKYNGKTAPVVEHISSNFQGAFASFLKHFSFHHQAEHWLESKLLEYPTIICSSFKQVRSQVVIAQQGEKAEGFIDLLALDTENKLMWVVELKSEKANGRAVSQAKNYAEWIQSNMSELLDESLGYFSGVKVPGTYHSAIAFVAPSYSSNFDSYIERELVGYCVKKVKVNSNWRESIKVESKQDFQPCTINKTQDWSKGHGFVANNNVTKRKMEAGEGEKHWIEDPLTNRIIEMAGRYNLRRRDPKKGEYINLCWCSQSGKALAQIHKCKSNYNGRALVIGNADEDCPKVLTLEKIEDYTQLSGDIGSNKPWLRAGSANFAHRKPAIFIPNSMLKEPDDYVSWMEVAELFRYAVQRYKESKGATQH